MIDLLDLDALSLSDDDDETKAARAALRRQQALYEQFANAKA